jgi:hypothetical protein
MTIEEVLGLSFEVCPLEELTSKMDIPNYFEVSNFYKTFNYLPIDENKLELDNLFVCSKATLEDKIYYILKFEGNLLFVCSYYLLSLNIALIDKNVYMDVLNYLVNIIDLSLLETKGLEDVL